MEIAFCNECGTKELCLDKKEVIEKFMFCPKCGHVNTGYGRIKEQCCICNNPPKYYIKHKLLSSKYKICQECESKGFYNKNIFNLEEIKDNGTNSSERTI